MNSVIQNPILKCFHGIYHCADTQISRTYSSLSYNVHICKMLVITVQILEDLNINLLAAVVFKE
jgi:hypothetical protein